MTNTTWKKRACPECGTATHSRSFRWVPGGVARRRCPDCGHEAETEAFRIYDELERMPPTIIPREDRCIVCGSREDLSNVDIPKVGLPVPACGAHADQPTVSLFYGEWVRFAKWSNSR